MHKIATVWPAYIQSSIHTNLLSKGCFWHVSFCIAPWTWSTTYTSNIVPLLALPLLSLNTSLEHKILTRNLSFSWHWLLIELDSPILDQIPGFYFSAPKSQRGSSHGRQQDAPEEAASWPGSNSETPSMQFLALATCLIAFDVRGRKKESLSPIAKNNFIRLEAVERCCQPSPGMADKSAVSCKPMSCISFLYFCSPPSTYPFSEPAGTNLTN